FLKACAIELAGQSAKAWIAGDALRDFPGTDAEAECLGLLVERRLRDQLGNQLAVETEGANLIRGQCAAELAQLVVVIFAELFRGNPDVADGEGGVAAKTAKNVADAPDGKADDQEAHDGRHQALAEPGRGGFVNTAKHRRLVTVRVFRVWRPYRERAKSLQLKKERAFSALDWRCRTGSDNRTRKRA